MYPAAWLDIDLGGLAHNINALRRGLRPGVRLMAVLKADAYGHGAVEIARRAAACGVDAFAVATLEEGELLRRAGVTGTILLLGTVEPVASFLDTLIAEGIEPTLSTREEALALHDACLRKNRTAHVHLKVDTGMSRLGVWWTEAGELARALSALPQLRLASVYSHLAGMNLQNGDGTDRQVDRFRCALRSIQATGIGLPAVHIANSAATLLRPDLHFDQVRSGIALFGIGPNAGVPVAVDLRPVMTLKARILLIKTVPAGEGVSYGAQFVSPKETRIGVLGIGYADGIPRCLSGRMAGIVCGRRVSQVGAITMNHLVMDLSEVPEASVGSTVTLLGSDGDHQITAADLATQAGTIPWEIVCGLGRTLPKVYRS